MLSFVRKLKGKTALLLTAMVALLAGTASAEIDTATMNGMLRDVAASLTAIATSLSTYIAPAMITLTVAVTILVIVVKMAKKPRSAS